MLALYSPTQLNAPRCARNVASIRTDSAFSLTLGTCSEDGGLADFLDSEQLALWPLADGTPEDIRAAGCVYGSLNYGWDLRKKLKPRIPMEDLIADALERVRARPHHNLSNTCRSARVIKTKHSLPML